MTEVRHPLTGQVVDVDLAGMRRELEAEYGPALGIATMKPTSVAMNYSALLRRRSRELQERIAYEREDQRNHEPWGD